MSLNCCFPILILPSLLSWGHYRCQSNLLLLPPSSLKTLGLGSYTFLSLQRRQPLQRRQSPCRHPRRTVTLQFQDHPWATVWFVLLPRVLHSEAFNSGTAFWSQPPMLSLPLRSQAVVQPLIHSWHVPSIPWNPDFSLSSNRKTSTLNHSCQTSFDFPPCNGKLPREKIPQHWRE